MSDRTSLRGKTKSNNYPEVKDVNVAVTWDESDYPYRGRSHGRVYDYVGNTDNNSREKSAEVIVGEDTSLSREGKAIRQEALRTAEGLNFIEVNIRKLPNARKKAEHIAR